MADTTIFEAGNGLVKAIQTESGSDTVRLVTQQDADPIITYAREMSELGGWSGDFKPAAEIPMAIVEKMMQEGSWGDPAAMKKWLNDPQNECFRIWKGRV